MSEESPRHWSRRCRQFGVWRNVCFFCRLLSGQPTVQQWRELIDDLWHLRQAEGIDLFVIDPLSAFLPRGSEKLVSAVLEALRSLEQLTADGAAVFLLRHPKKGDVLAGQDASSRRARAGIDGPWRAMLSAVVTSEHPITSISL